MSYLSNFMAKTNDESEDTAQKYITDLTTVSNL